MRKIPRSGAYYWVRVKSYFSDDWVIARRHPEPRNLSKHPDARLGRDLFLWDIKGGWYRTSDLEEVGPEVPPPPDARWDKKAKRWKKGTK